MIQRFFCPITLWSLSEEQMANEQQRWVLWRSKPSQMANDSFHQRPTFTYGPRECFFSLHRMVGCMAIRCNCHGCLVSSSTYRMLPEDFSTCRWRGAWRVLRILNHFIWTRIVSLMMVPLVIGCGWNQSLIRMRIFDDGMGTLGNSLGFNWATLNLDWTYN